MEGYHLLLTSIVAVLLFLCINCEDLGKSEGLFELTEHVRKRISNFYLTLGTICIFAVQICWAWAKDFGANHKYYCRRISLQEYEYQKQTLTQIVVNELVNTKEYKEYLRKKELEE
jgi:hypothetical protein